MTDTTPIRMLLVDDHIVVREGFAALMSLDPRLQVLGQAGNCADALTQFDRCAPDIVVLDYFLPDGDGTDVIAVLAQRARPVPVLVLSSFGQDKNVFNALQSGAAGYVLKSATAEELFSAIRTVARGGNWVSGDLREAIVRHAAQPNLTEREQGVLALMAAGHSNVAIAKLLGISLATVKTHAYNVMQKLGARNRTDAVWRARQQGFPGL